MGNLNSIWFEIEPKKVAYRNFRIVNVAVKTSEKNNWEAVLVCDGYLRENLKANGIRLFAQNKETLKKIILDMAHIYPPKERLRVWVESDA